MMKLSFKPRTVESRIFRDLSKLENYHQFDNDMDITHSNFISGCNEHIFGLYENIINSTCNAIAISKYGIYHNNNNIWIYIPYIEMLHITIIEISDNLDKSQASHIRLKLQNDHEYILPVLGHRERHRDVCNMYNFLRSMKIDMDNSGQEKTITT